MTGIELESDTRSQTGVGILVGLDLLDGDYLERCELELAVEREEERLDRLLGVQALAGPEEAAPRGPGAMKNLNIVFGKPVLVQVERKAAEQDGQRDQASIVCVS